MCRCQWSATGNRAATPRPRLDRGRATGSCGTAFDCIIILAMTELKLGILPWTQAATMQEQLDVARFVEELGYDHLWTWDHIYAIFGDPHQPIYEGWTLLAGWAMITQKVQLGLLVGANTFRNPAVVA